MKRLWVVVIILEILILLFLIIKLLIPSFISLPEPSVPILTTPQVEGPFPSEVIDLTDWKITLPVGTKENPTHPVEIKQPDLANFKIDPWFTITPDRKGVVFRAPVNGATTGGTKYPRSELREMTDNGTIDAGWSSTSGIHTMSVSESIAAVPKRKKQIVAGQIHDDTHDILVVRLDYPKLYINVNGKNVYTLDSNYMLGKEFSVKFEVNDGETKVYYNEGSVPVYILPLNYSNAYFKAGAYTQSNCNKEGLASLCNIENFGEVVIYQLIVKHQ